MAGISLSWLSLLACVKPQLQKNRVINNSFRWLMRIFWQIIRNWPSWFLLIYFHLPFGCNWLTHAMEDFLIRLTEIKSQGHSGIDIWCRYFDELTHAWTAMPISFLWVVPVVTHYVLCIEANGWLIHLRIIELCFYIL